MSATFETGEKTLSIPCFILIVLKPNSTRMQLYGNTHTQLCVPIITLPLCIRSTPVCKTCLGEHVFLQATLQELFTEPSLFPHFSSRWVSGKTIAEIASEL